MKLLITSLFALIVFALGAQIDKNQAKAASNFKSGKYKTYKNVNWNAVEKDEVEVKIEKDNNGQVEAIYLGKFKYKLSYQSLYDNKKTTGTHFTNGRLRLVYLKDRLYVFELFASKKFADLRFMVGKKQKKFDQTIEILKEYTEIINQEDEKADKYLRDNLSKTNPEKYYSKLDKEAEGLRHVVYKKMHGFIDANNDVVIPLEYQQTANSFYKGNTLAKKNGKFGAINKDNKQMVPIKFAGIYWAVSGAILCVNQDNTYTIFDTDGKEIISNLSYVEDKVFSDEAIYIKKGSKHGRITKRFSVEWILDNKEVDKLIEEENIYIATKTNGKVGLYNKDFESVLDFNYQSISPFSKELYIVQYQNKYGVYKLNHGFTTECLFKYDNDKLTFGDYIAELNNAGSLSFKNGYKTPLIKSKTPLLSFRDKYSESEPIFQNKVSRVKKEDKFGYVNDKGLVVFEPQFLQAKPHDVEGVVFGKTESGYGALAITKDTIIPFIYQKNVYAKDGIVVMSKSNRFYVYNTSGVKLAENLSNIDYPKNGTFKVEQNGLVGQLDKTGTIKWNNGTITHNQSFLDELTWTNNYDKVGNVGGDEYIRVEKEDKVGYVDIEGNILIPLIYKNGQPSFREDKCIVQTENNYSVIDRKNKVLFTFTGRVVDWGVFSDDALALTFDTGNEYPTLKVFNPTGKILFEVPHVDGAVTKIGDAFYVRTREQTGKSIYEFLLFDKNGKIMFENYALKSVSYYRDDIWKVSAKTGYGLLDESDLTFILPPVYDEIKTLNDEYWKFMIKSKSGRKEAWGVCDNQGKIKYNAIFKYVKYSYGTYSYSLINDLGSGEYECEKAPYINGSWYCGNDAVTNRIKFNVDLSLVIVNDTKEFQTFDAYSVYSGGSYKKLQIISLSPGEVYHLQGNRDGKLVLSKTTPGYYKGFFEATYAYQTGRVILLSKEL